MGGFSAAIGGLGDAAHDYGVQVRNLLEGRRSSMANLMLQLAQLESDPNKVPMYLTHAASLLSGKDLAKTLPAVLKTIQQSQQSNSQLGQAAQALTAQIAGPPVAQTPSPTPPGGVPGTATSPVAAQPSSSPVQPSGADKFMATGAAAPSPAAAPPQPTPQTFPVIPPVEQTAAAAPAQSFVPPVGEEASPDKLPFPYPKFDTATDIAGRMIHSPEWGGWGNRAALREAAQQESARAENVRQAYDLSRNQLRVGLDALGLLGSPLVRQTYDNLREQGFPEYAIPSLIAGALHVPMTGMVPMLNASMRTYTLHGQNPNFLSQQFPQEWAKAHITDMNSPVDVIFSALDRKPIIIGGKAVRQTLMPGVNEETGQYEPWAWNQYTPPVPPEGIKNVARPELTPRLVTTTKGTQKFVRPINFGNVELPDVINPSMAGTSSSTVQTQSGTQTMRRRVSPVGGGGGAVAPIGGSASSGGGSTRAGAGGGPNYFAYHNSAGELTGNDVFKKTVRDNVAAMMDPRYVLSTSQFNAMLNALGKSKMPLRTAVEEEMAIHRGDLTGPLTWDISSAERAQFSAQALRAIDDIKSQISSLEKNGELGKVMGRWNEFWTGTIGEDLTKNQDFVKLRDNVDLLNKALGRIHGGARGGGSIQMVESLAKNLSVAKMDPATLRSALSVEENWLKKYANPRETTQIPSVHETHSKEDLSKLSDEELLRRLSGGK